jgi:hypothetical protein
METKQNDELRKEAIRKICEERNITELVHFTHIDNLISILDKGLMTVEELEESGVNYKKSDHQRLDGQKDAVSLSISFPNYKMFHSKSGSQKEKWVVLSLLPKILWEFDCVFCTHNASSHKISRYINLHKLFSKGADALERLFENYDDKERSPEIPSCYPTNPQAEVLVFGTIPSSYIQKIYFYNGDVAKRWAESLNQSQKEIARKFLDGFLINEYYFSPREDYSNW